MLCKIEEANIADYFLSEYYDNAQQYHASHKTVGLAGPGSPSGFQRPNGGEGNLGALPGIEHPLSLNNDPPALYVAYNNKTLLIQLIYRTIQTIILCAHL